MKRPNPDDDDGNPEKPKKSALKNKSYPETPNQITSKITNVKTLVKTKTTPEYEKTSSFYWSNFLKSPKKDNKDKTPKVDDSKEKEKNVGRNKILSWLSMSKPETSKKNLEIVPPERSRRQSMVRISEPGGYRRRQSMALRDRRQSMSLRDRRQSIAREVALRKINGGRKNSGQNKRSSESEDHEDDSSGEEGGAKKTVGWFGGWQSVSSEYLQYNGSEEIEISETESTEDARNSNFLSVRVSIDEANIETPYNLTGNEIGIPQYTIANIIDEAGFGKFQIILTFLTGLIWMAFACEYVVFSYIGNFMACGFVLERWEYAMMSGGVFLGIVIGYPLFEELAIRIGRKKCLAVATLLTFFFASASCLTTNEIQVILMRCVMGIAMGGMFQGQKLCIEYYPTKMKGYVLFYLNTFSAVGSFLTIGVTMIIMSTVNEWKLLLFACAAPSIPVFLLIKWFPESAVHHASTGQIERCVKQLEQVVKMNRKEMTPGEIVFTETCQREILLLPEVLGTKFRKSTLLFWYISFAVGFTYYAVLFLTPSIATTGFLSVSWKNSSEPFPFSAEYNNSTYSPAKCVICKHYSAISFKDVLWITASEVPGIILMKMLSSWCERKILIMLSGSMSAVLSLLLLLDMKHDVIAKMIFFVARGNIAGLRSVIFLVTVEAYPSSLTSIILGTCIMSLLLGGFLSPFLTQLLIVSKIHNGTAITIMGIIIFLATIASGCLPLKTINQYKQNETLTDHERNRLEVIN